MYKKWLVIGVILLFLLIFINTMVIGSSTYSKDENISRNKVDEYTVYVFDEVNKSNIITEEISFQSSRNFPIDSPWPMQCHDNRHTSLSPYSTAHIDGLEKWRRRGIVQGLGGMSSGPIVGDDGSIYYGDKDSYVYALYPNGTMKWAYKTDNRITSAPALAEDGTLYVASWDAGLYALNSTTGKRKWRCGCGSSIAASPAIGDDGIIYLGTLSDKNEIVAVNPNGTIKWKYQTGDRIYSDPAIGDDGTIYIGSDNSYLYAMNPNGTLKWRFKTGHHIKASPSIAEDGTIYVPSYDDYLYALYPNGTIRWKCSNVGAGTNPAIGEDGTIYLSDYDRFHAIYPNGTKKWTIDLGNRHIDASSCAISADGTIYFGTNIGNMEGGEIVALNLDGTVKWRKTICDRWSDSSPCIGKDGTVYIGSQFEGGGYLHAFGPVDSNSPPESPTISGETNGKINEKYWYIISSIDPDNNPVQLYIDWGDGSEGWQAERASGETYYYAHEWNKKGNYTIRAKAKDVLGEESDWATLEVTMPKTKQSTNWYFLQFLEKHPHMFPILRQLLGL